MTTELHFPDRNEIISWLYNAYHARCPTEDDTIKADYETLYTAMNGMPLEEMDRILSPLCVLCTDHARSAFCAGVRIGFRLAQELHNN